MKLLIKNMVSLRCKLIIKSVLHELGIQPLLVELGEVEIKGGLSHKKKRLLNAELLKFGFELMEDQKSILIEKIKNIVIQMVHYGKAGTPYRS